MCRAVDRLSHLCVALNLTPQDFADRMGLPLRRANRVLRPTRAPSRKLIARVLGAFPQVAPTWLLIGEGPVLLPTTLLGNYIAVNYGHTTQINCSCTGTISALQAHLLEKERLIQHLLQHAT